MSVFNKPLFHGEIHDHSDWNLRVNGDMLIAAFTEMNVPIPYKDFSKIFASIAYDIQTDRFAGNFRHGFYPNLLIEHFKEKKYK